VPRRIDESGHERTAGNRNNPGSIYGWICFKAIHSLIVRGGGGGSLLNQLENVPGFAAGGLFIECVAVSPLLRRGAFFFGVNKFFVPLIRFFVPLVTPENTLGLVVFETFVVLTAVWDDEPRPNQLLFDDSSARAARGANHAAVTESKSRKNILTGRTPDEGTPPERERSNC